MGLKKLTKIFGQYCLCLPRFEPKTLRIQVRMVCEVSVSIEWWSVNHMDNSTSTFYISGNTMVVFSCSQRYSYEQPVLGTSCAHCPSRRGPTLLSLVNISTSFRCFICFKPPSPHVFSFFSLLFHYILSLRVLSLQVSCL